jgi:hypothetical protein
MVLVSGWTESMERNLDAAIRTDELVGARSDRRFIETFLAEFGSDMFGHHRELDQLSHQRGVRLAGQ